MTSTSRATTSTSVASIIPFVILHRPYIYSVVDSSALADLIASLPPSFDTPVSPSFIPSAKESATSFRPDADLPAHPWQGKAAEGR